MRHTWSDDASRYASEAIGTDTDRPIGHYKGPTWEQDRKACCGKLMEGIPVPGAEWCVVCFEFFLAKNGAR